MEYRGVMEVHYHLAGVIPLVHCDVPSSLGCTSDSVFLMIGDFESF